MIRSIRRAAVLGVLGCLAPLVFAQKVPPQEIEALWVGKTLQGAVPSGRGFTMALQPDGVITIAGAAAQDTGAWRLSAEGYCVTWKTIRAGTERCFTLHRLGSGEIQMLNPDGSVSGTVAKIE